MRHLTEWFPTVSRLVLLFLGILAFVFLLVALAFADVLIRAPVPGNAATLAESLRRFPASFSVYRRITDSAFDLQVGAAALLWRESYSALLRFAPSWTAARRAFVRQGFFHWSELSPPDRRLVLREAAVLMRDAQTFAELHRPLWQLTGDFGYLRAAAPREIDSRQRLMNLAAQAGEFEHYRALREELTRVFVEVLQQKKMRRAPAEQVLSDLVRMPRYAATREAMRAYIEYLSADPPSGVETDPAQLTAFLDYAIRAGVPGLEAFAALMEEHSPLSPPMRARLALAAGNFAMADRIERAALNRSPEWSAYLTEHARADAGRGDLAEAERKLRAIALSEIESPPVILARAEIAAKRGDAQRAESLYQELQERFAPLNLGGERWSGLCDNLICFDRMHTFLFSRRPTRISLRFRNHRSDSVPPYIEIFLDDQRVAEGEIPQSKRFDIVVPAELHRLEVKLINVVDRRGERRIVRLEP